MSPKTARRFLRRNAYKLKKKELERTKLQSVLNLRMKNGILKRYPGNPEPGIHQRVQ